ncbi:MAG: organic hydroperoxide resistance protein [Anaerolineaceae bacterium]|nr:organic hydroperoxide resistance protein [Anaerolineaceae bacterium]
MKPIYQTTVVAKGGRDGHVRSTDGVLDLDVRVPRELRGQGGAFTNPEQLFAAGYAACFDSALNHVARTEREDISSEVTATVGLKLDGLSGFELAVTLDVKISGVDKATAEKLLEKAHQTCPYSKAIHNNVDVKLNLITE